MTKNVLVKLSLSDGSKSLITLPAFLGTNVAPFTDQDTGDAPNITDYNAIAAVFATDDGATVNSIGLYAVTNDTLDAIADWQASAG